MTSVIISRMKVHVTLLLSELEYLGPGGDPKYIPPEATLAALEVVALNAVSPAAIAEAQSKCPEVKSHKQGSG